MKKNITLTFLSMELLLVFFLLPKNREWFNGRVITYWNDFRIQKNKLDIEYRKTKRWESSYTISKQITDSFAKNDLKNVIVLLPPSAYFKERKIDYHVPEPAIFYYYTGLRTVWINSNEAKNANWIVTAHNGQLEMIPMNDQKVLLDSINIFKKYPVGL